HYHVNTLKTGKSFYCQQVSAIQNEELIFQLMASFQQNEIGVTYCPSMPDVCSYQQLTTQSLLAAYHQLPQEIIARFDKHSPIELRIVNTENSPVPLTENKKYIWFKATSPVSSEQILQQMILSYFSDFYL